MLLAERHESERLRQIIKELQRHRFGRKAESLPKEQMLLGLEDVQQVAACTEASQDEVAPEGRAERARKRRNNRGALPTHLPRIEVVVDLDAKTRPCCQGDLHQIGEDKSERLDMVPAQFRVVVTRRPKYACRSCEDGVLQAEAPARVIEGGLPRRQPSPRFWCPNMPIICRSTGRRRFTPARASLSIDQRWRTGSGMPPSTCARCMSAFSRCFARGPSCSSTRRRCRCSIPVEVTKTGQLWAYAADDRPWGGLDPPGIAYVYAPDRKAERLFSHLAGFKGVLQVDGYNAYPKLAERGEVELAFCWVHMRRNFYELATAGPAPIASEALKHTAAFYAIEKQIRGRSGGTSPRAAAEEPTTGRCLRSMAARQAGSHQPEDQARRGHPLRPLALERLNALHR